MGTDTALTVATAEVAVRSHRKVKPSVMEAGRLRVAGMHPDERRCCLVCACLHGVTC